MASLTLAVGNLSVTYTVADAQAVIALTRYIRVYGGPLDGTNPEKLEWVMADLVRHIADAGTAGAMDEAIVAAREAVLRDNAQYRFTRGG